MGRVALIAAAILLFNAISTFQMSGPVQAAFPGVNSRIAVASNLDSGNYTYETTLTSFTIVYNTTTLTQTVYLTSTTLIPISSTFPIPTSTTVTKTQVLTSTERSVTTSVTSVTITNTASTNVTNTQNVTASAAQTTMRTTETTTRTSTTYTNVLSTSMLTEVTILTSSARVTQTIMILANPVAEIAITLVVLAAVAALLIPRIRARRFTSKVCPQCRYSNPPHARRFCIKCGNPLETPKT